MASSRYNVTATLASLQIISSFPSNYFYSWLHSANPNTTPGAVSATSSDDLLNGRVSVAQGVFHGVDFRLQLA
ncbi:MAG: hypothetical protein MK171_03085 [Pirellulales bacterium]|nr:hypothetical protein [Pirellulales bacterium]